MVDLMSRVILGVIGASLRRTRLLGVRISGATRATYTTRVTRIPQAFLAYRASARMLAGGVASPAYALAQTIPQPAWRTLAAASHSERPLGAYLRRPWPSPWRLRGNPSGNPPSDPSSPTLWMDSLRAPLAPLATGATLT